MSRIGRKEIELVKGVKASIVGQEMLIEGPKGKMSSPIPQGINASIEGNLIRFTRGSEDGPTRAKHGLARALANNCVVGVSTGFTRKLQVIGVGYRASVVGNVIELHLGYSHPINFPLPNGVSASVDQDRQTKAIILTLQGVDKQMLGQVAANIRSLRPPEPYKGKGVKYLEEQILRKAGKSGKK